MSLDVGMYISLGTLMLGSVGLGWLAWYIRTHAENRPK